MKILGWIKDFIFYKCSKKEQRNYENDIKIYDLLNELEKLRKEYRIVIEHNYLTSEILLESDTVINIELSPIKDLYDNWNDLIHDIKKNLRYSSLNYEDIEIFTKNDMLIPYKEIDYTDFVEKRSKNDEGSPIIILDKESIKYFYDTMKAANEMIILQKKHINFCKQILETNMQIY